MGHAPGHGMMMPGPAGKWWDNPELARRLNLTAEQQKKMDEVFQQHRLRLIDLHAALERVRGVGAHVHSEAVETPVCTMVWCSDLEGNTFALHKRRHV